MPDWLDVDLLQTIALFVATVVAWLTYRGEKDARKDAVLERRFDHVADRVVDLGAALTIHFNASGQMDKVLIAQRNLRSALATIDEAATAPLVLTRGLITHQLETLRPPEVIDAALAEVAENVRRLPE